MTKNSQVVGWRFKKSISFHPRFGLRLTSICNVSGHTGASRGDTEEEYYSLHFILQMLTNNQLVKPFWFVYFIALWCETVFLKRPTALHVSMLRLPISDLHFKKMLLSQSTLLQFVKVIEHKEKPVVIHLCAAGLAPLCSGLNSLPASARQGTGVRIPGKPGGRAWLHPLFAIGCLG